jgi:hypothetical protein
MTSTNMHRVEGRLRQSDFTNLTSGLDFYWKGGELNLEKQGESVEQDHVDELGFDIGQSQAIPLGSAASSSNISSSPFSV